MHIEHNQIAKINPEIIRDAEIIFDLTFRTSLEGAYTADSRYGAFLRFIGLEHIDPRHLRYLFAAISRKLVAEAEVNESDMLIVSNEKLNAIAEETMTLGTSIGLPLRKFAAESLVMLCQQILEQSNEALKSVTPPKKATQDHFTLQLLAYYYLHLPQMLLAKQN